MALALFLGVTSLLLIDETDFDCVAWYVNFWSSV